MSEKQVRKGCALALIIYVVLAMAFYWVSGDQLHYRDEETDAIAPTQVVGEFIEHMELRQPFVAQASEIREVSMKLSTFGRENTSHVNVQIADETGVDLAQIQFYVADVVDNAIHKISFGQPVQVVPGQRYVLVISSPDATSGNGITAWQGNTISAARADVPVEITEHCRVLLKA